MEQEETTSAPPAIELGGLLSLVHCGKGETSQNPEEGARSPAKHLHWIVAGLEPDSCCAEAIESAPVFLLWELG